MGVGGAEIVEPRAREARGQQYSDFRPPRDKLAGQANAVEPAWHDDIAEQQVDRLAAVDQRQRIGGVLGLAHPVADLVERTDQNGAQPGIVLDDEDALARAFEDPGIGWFGLVVIADFIAQASPSAIGRALCDAASAR